MGIPLVDLKWQHAQVADEVKAGMAEVMANTAFILGPQVAEFERAFAEFQETPHCAGVGSGTDALEMALDHTANRARLCRDGRRVPDVDEQRLEIVR